MLPAHPRQPPLTRTRRCRPAWAGFDKRLPGPNGRRSCTLLAVCTAARAAQTAGREDSRHALGSVRIHRERCHQSWDGWR